MILEFKSSEITIYEYSLADGELNCVDTRIKKPWFVKNIYLSNHYFLENQ